MFLSQRQGRGSSTDPGGASPPGSAAAEAPSVPDDQVALPVPWDPTIIHILGAVTAYCTVPTIGSGTQHPPGGAAVVWCASSTGMTPMTGQILLAGKGYRTLVCGWPHRTPTTPFSYLGSPCTDSLDCHRRPPPGVPAANVAGVSREHSQNLSCTRNLKGPDAASNPAGPCRSGSGVSGVFASAATRADTRTSRRYGVSP